MRTCSGVRAQLNIFDLVDLVVELINIRIVVTHISCADCIGFLNRAENSDIGAMGGKGVLGDGDQGGDRGLWGDLEGSGFWRRPQGGSFWAG